MAEKRYVVRDCSFCDGGREFLPSAGADAEGTVTVGHSDLPGMLAVGSGPTQVEQQYGQRLVDPSCLLT